MSAEPLKTCAITGANGYLGSRLVRLFQSAGWRVLEISRKAANAESHAAFTLGEDIDPTVLRGVDHLIHCAHDFRASTEAEMNRINVDGSLRLFRSAKSAGVKTIVFISSMAAFDGCKSLYGRAKLRIEKESASMGVLSIRPGTIYGNESGGIVGSMRRIVRALPVVPLIGSGSARLYTVHEEDLCRFVEAVGMRPVEASASPLNACSPHPVTFLELLRKLAAADGRRPLFVPVPAALIVFGLRMVEALGLPIGLRSDSVISLVNANPSAAASSKVGVVFRDFDAADL